jgi:hypothetical protein
MRGRRGHTKGREGTHKTLHGLRHWHAYGETQKHRILTELQLGLKGDNAKAQELNGAKALGAKRRRGKAQCKNGDHKGKEGY